MRLCDHWLCKVCVARGMPIQNLSIVVFLKLIAEIQVYKNRANIGHFSNFLVTFDKFVWLKKNLGNPFSFNFLFGHYLVVSKKKFVQL